MKLVCRSTRRFCSMYLSSTPSPWSADDVMPELSMFGNEAKICLSGPSSLRRTCVTGTIVSPASRSAERATAVYSAHPYFSNRSPSSVTIWSRGIGPSTATLRLLWVFVSVAMNASRSRHHCLCGGSQHYRVRSAGSAAVNAWNPRVVGHRQAWRDPAWSCHAWTFPGSPPVATSFVRGKANLLSNGPWFHRLSYPARGPPVRCLAFGRPTRTEDAVLTRIALQRALARHHCCLPATPAPAAR